MALEGGIREHHRFWLRKLLDHLNFLEQKIADLEQEIVHRCGPYQEALERWNTIPGVDITACSLVADRGSCSCCAIEPNRLPDRQSVKF